MFPVNDTNTGRIKFTGTSKAIVIDNQDPEKLGKIRVRSPILGDTPWIPYLQMSFGFDVPEPGDIVYLECDGGFETHPIAWGKLITGEAEEVKIPEVFQRLKPTNRGFYTPGGHLVEFDDGDDTTGNGKGIRITTSDESFIKITEDSNDNKISIQKKEGTKIELDGTEDKITLLTNSGEQFTIDNTDGFQLTTDKTSLSMKEGSVNIVASDNKIDIGSDSLINIENTAGNKVQVTTDSITGENSTGSKFTLSPTESSLLDATGAGVKASNGQVALGGPTAEVLDLLDQAFTALSTQTAAGFGSPTSTIAQFAQLAVLVKTIKGSL